MRFTFVACFVCVLSACGTQEVVVSRDGLDEASQRATAAKAPTENGIASFFGQEQVALELRGPAPSIDEAPIAIRLGDGVGLALRLQDLPLPKSGGTVMLNPLSFSGGALGAGDLKASNAAPVAANQVAQVIANASQYRTLCAFEDRSGGPVVHGTMNVSYGGANYTVQAEVVTSERSFAAAPADSACGMEWCISLPNKFCSDSEITFGRCRAFRCGMTLGDMLGTAATAGLTVPPQIIAGGVDTVAGWLGAQGYVVSGTCAKVYLLGLVSLGCQCRYL
ncbi:MAG: hypothetical protein JNK82_19910 [Myxococcaceae bacterium]|nr:hypothetical protein [Myxococcaceae bacterium]